MHQIANSFYRRRNSVKTSLNLNCPFTDIWVQPTVTFPTGDHVNVLHDYRKTGPSKILKLFISRCHHLVDMLVEFCRNRIFRTLLKWLNVPCPSIFTNFCINYYAHVPCGEKFAKNPSAYLNHLKIHGYTTYIFYQQTCQCVCSNAVMSDDMIFLKLHTSKITVSYIRNTPGSLTEHDPVCCRAQILLPGSCQSRMRRKGVDTVFKTNATLFYVEQNMLTM